MVEHRKHKRLPISIPVNIKILGLVTSSQTTINIKTENVSLEGLTIVIKIKIRSESGRPIIEDTENSIEMIPYLLLHYKPLELGINIPPKGRMIKVVSKVVWYDSRLREGFYYLRAGIFIEEMRREDRERWLEFLRPMARIQYDY